MTLKNLDLLFFVIVKELSYKSMFKDQKLSCYKTNKI